MQRFFIKAASGISILLATGAASAQAQKGTVLVTSHLGMYLPIGVRVEEYSATGELDLRKRQLSALLIGARARVGSEHFGIEATAGVVPFSWVAVSQNRTTVDVNSAVFLASLKGVARLNGTVGPGVWGFHGAAGLGGVRRTGDAWTAGDPRGVLALVLGAGGRLGFSGVPFGVRIDLEDYVSLDKTETAPPAARPDWRLHHDVVWSLGLTLPIESRP